MKRVIAFLLAGALAVGFVSAQVHQSATVTRGEHDQVEIMFAELASVHSGTDGSFLRVSVTLNGLPQFVDPGGITLALDEDLNGTVDLTKSLDGWATDTFTHGIAVSNKFKLRADRPAVADGPYVVTITRLQNISWSTLHSLTVALPGVSDSVPYQLDVDLTSSHDTPDSSWLHSVTPSRGLVLRPLAGALEFAPVAAPIEMAIGLVLPDDSTMAKVNLSLLVTEGGADLTPSDAGLTLVVADTNYLSPASSPPPGLTVSYETVAGADGLYKLELTNTGTFTWSELTEVRIDTSGSSGDVILTTKLTADDGTDPYDPLGLGIVYVTPAATPVLPTIVGWLDEPLTTSSYADLGFMGDESDGGLTISESWQTALTGLTLAPEPAGSTNYRIVAGTTAADGTGKAQIDFADPITPTLTPDHDTNQITGFLIPVEIKNPSLDAPSGLRVLLKPSDAEISETGGAYPIAQSVGAFQDAAIRLTNIGGGIVTVPSASLTPDYLWQTSAGYLGVSFAAFPVLPPPIGQEEIVTRFVPVLDPPDINLGYNEWVEVPLRYVPVGASDGGLPATDSWTVSFPFSTTQRQDRAAGGVQTVIESGSEAVQIDTTAQAPPIRDSFDLIAVLDKSGSMSGIADHPDGPGQISKMEGLRAAASLLYTIMDAIGTDDDTTGVIVYSRDAQEPIDVNSLSTEQPGADMSPGFAFPRVGAAAHVAGTLDTGGTTSISDALALAVSEMPPVATDRGRSILLMTDGRHNTGPGDAWHSASDLPDDFDATLDGLGIPAGSLGAPDPATQALIQGIRMNVVGLGADGSNLEGDKLQEIAAGYDTTLTQPADDTGPLVHQFLPGAYRHSLYIDSLGIFFAQILADSFFEAQVPDDDPLTLALNESATRAIALNASTKSAVFYVTWSDPRVDVYFTLMDPGGREHKATRAVGYSYLSISDLPAFSLHNQTHPGGEWNLDISATRAEGADDLPETVDIEYAAFITDPVVHAEFFADRGIRGTGDTITLSAVLREAGAPILGAECTALVTVPLVGLGDFLYENAGSVDPGMPEGGDGPDGPEVQMLDAILEANPDGLDRVTVPLQMRDNGAGADAVTGDGIYSVTLTESGDATTVHSGIYTYRFLAEGTTLLGERFERTSAISGYVTAVADPANTVTTVVVADPGTAYVRITPRDRFGHLLDPISRREYSVVPDDPATVDFRATRLANRFDGSEVYELEATSGRFALYQRAEDIVRVQALPVLTEDAPADLAPLPPVNRFALDLFGGYTTYQLAVPVNSGWMVGVRGRVNLGQYIGLEAELGISQTTNTAAEDVTVFQYGANVAGIIPFLIGPVRPYVTVGFGRQSYLEPAGAVSATSMPLGLGLRWYPHWEMGGGLSAEVRDIMQFNPFSSGGLEHMIQLIVGVHWHVGSR